MSDCFFLSNDLEFDKICRACLTKKLDMRPLYGSSLAQMFHTVTTIQVTMGDGFPEQMCIQCILQISRAFTFRQQCERSESILKLYLAQMLENHYDSTETVKHEPQCIISSQNSNEIPTEMPMKPYINETTSTTPNEIENRLEHKENSELIFVQTIAQINQTVLDDINNIDETHNNEGSLMFHSTNHTNEEHELHNHTLAFHDVKMEMLPSIQMQPINSEDITINGQTTDNISTESYDHFSNLKDNSLPHITTLKSEKCLENEPDLNRFYDKSNFCEICLTDFPTKIELKIHDEEFHNIKKIFECSYCHKQFAENKILKRHLKTHLENKPHVCLTCGMSFSESSNLTKHMKKHTGELRNVVGKPHLCSVCGKRFKWASSLSKHMNHHTKHKILKCDFCPKYYVEARSLHIHLRSHTGEKPYVCDICHKGFTQMGNLEKHVRVHTGEKPFLCNICGKGFSQSGYVTIHLRTHTGEKPYECSDCGKCFAGSNTLAIHKRTHTGVKPYTCHLCAKSFARQETLIIHFRTHTGEKPHVCSVCDKAFNSSGHLSGHMKLHTGIKPYPCSVCGKRFTGSSSLKIHMRSHTGEKPYVCNICGKSFTQNSSLSTHLLTHPPDSVPVDYEIKKSNDLFTEEPNKI